jgi:hypothetical protein
MEQDSKAKAAIAGVMQYIQVTEEENVSHSGVQFYRGQSPWALSGRQAIMQMRNLLQRGVLRRR